MFLFDRSAKTRMVTPDEALPGRDTRPFGLAGIHTVLGTPVEAPVPTGHAEIAFGMGCFWGVERLYWSLPGVWTTAVGYAAGTTPNPTYEEVCSGRTNHAEVALVVHDPREVDLEQLLAVFWENHDPTQQMGQGNDVGTQYRSLILPTTDAQREVALDSRERYQARLAAAGYGQIATEVLEPEEMVEGLPASWGYAEDYHQQYLSDAKNPHGYCGIEGTGVSCPVGVL